MLCSSPIVAIANPDLTFIVKVDSSKFGVGCILEQEDPNTKQRYVIEYASKKYNKAQQNYPAIELEVCGLIFAIKHWCNYLIGKPFIVETDSKAVQWIKGKRDCLGKLGRWSLYLENFDFSTVHVAGKNHLAADALSRMYEDSTDVLINELENSSELETNKIFADIKNWSVEINNDPEFTSLIDKEIVLKDGVFIKANDSNNIIVVPQSLREKIVEHLHDKFGHPGISKTISRVKDRFYWPGLTKFVKLFCKNCHMCAINKDNPAPNNAPLLPIETDMLEPFQKVALDILGPLPESENGSKYLLVLQDYFTKWPEAIALKSVDSNIVIDWLNSEIIPRYGVFSELVTDQGVQFICEKFKDYCKSLGVKKRPTTPFHAQSDGMVEKFNRTFLNMARNYVNENQTDWHMHISVILFSYRTAINDTIKVAPCEALQVRKLKLPVDVLRPPSLKFGGENSDYKSFDALCEKMKIVRAAVRSNACSSAKKRKDSYDNAKNSRNKTNV